MEIAQEHEEQLDEEKEEEETKNEEEARVTARNGYCKAKVGMSQNTGQLQSMFDWLGWFAMQFTSN